MLLILLSLSYCNIYTHFLTDIVSDVDHSLLLTFSMSSRIAQNGVFFAAVTPSNI